MDGQKALDRPEFYKHHNIEREETVKRRQFTSLGIPAIRYVRILAIFITLVLSANLVSAAGEPKAAGTDPKPTNTPIQVTADKLISNNEEQYAEFVGNVKANQGTLMITSDRLIIYFRGNLLKREKKNNEGERLKKIVATGNVKIETEQYSAQTDNLEYDTVNMTYKLTGDNSKISSGKNYVAGSIITLYQKDGRVKVESGENSRIKALFYPNDKSSSAFKIKKPKK